jgi:tRNA pseudouridine38-40 synthase
MRRIALKVEYQGTHYHGWQRQSGVRSLQQTLEEGLCSVLRHEVELTCAGRTDKGVHARAQIVHLNTPTSRDLKALVVGTNVFLPKDIRVVGAKELGSHSDFHARYSATARQYQYWIFNRSVHAPLVQDRALWMKYPLCEGLMHQAVQYLIGEHDFEALRSSECQSTSPFRCVHSARVDRVSADWVCFQIEANAFLHHMVRNIVGLLLQIGQGFRPPEWVLDVLASRDRRCAGVTAPPEGLYLTGVRYPEHFGLWSPEARWAIF